MRKEEQETGDDRKEDGSAKIIYGKTVENLIEIAFVYAGLLEQHKNLSDIDSITWKEMFVEWANEFEEEHADMDWIENDYLAEIGVYAQKKILEYAGLDE